MSSSTIYLPVSLGEAIDKLTILDIKLAHITDARRADVLVEYTLLYEKLASHIEQHKTLYESMKKVNVAIWDYMDDLRDGTLSEEAYFRLCKKTIVYNDIRFRIKNKINNAAGSLLKEQKGYKVNSVLIELNDSLTSVTEFIAPIRYYSCLYDQVVVVYKGSLDLASAFTEDPTILFPQSVDTGASFKQRFQFHHGACSKEEVLSVFQITEAAMNEIL